MKHSITVFLLVIFTFNIGASHIILRIRKFQIRREIIQKIEQGICESDLIIFTITPENEDQISWENNEEFAYKGILYDVVHTESIDQNTKVYHCISDLQETNLIADYEKNLEKNRKDKSRRRNGPRFVKFIREIIPYSPENEIVFSTTNGGANVNYFNSYTPLILEISTPPPKQIL